MSAAVKTPHQWLKFVAKGSPQNSRLKDGRLISGGTQPTAFGVLLDGCRHPLPRKTRRSSPKGRGYPAPPFPPILLLLTTVHDTLWPTSRRSPCKTINAEQEAAVQLETM
jgi:hypothetical protein